MKWPGEFWRRLRFLAYMAQQAVETYGWTHGAEMVDGLGLARNHAGSVDPGHAIRRVPRRLPRRCALFIPNSCVTAPQCDVGHVRAIHALDFRRCALCRAAAGQSPIVRRARRLTAAVVGVILNLSVWFALNVLFGKLTEMHAGPMGWYAFDRWRSTSRLGACRDCRRARVRAASQPDRGGHCDGRPWRDRAVRFALAFALDCAFVPATQRQIIADSA